MQRPHKIMVEIDLSHTPLSFLRSHQYGGNSKLNSSISCLGCFGNMCTEGRELGVVQAKADREVP